MKQLIQYPVKLLLILSLSFTGCGNNPDKSNTTTVTPGKAPQTDFVESTGYDMRNVEKKEMKKKLKEISGIRYLQDNLFLAIQDESGIIFTVDFASGEISQELAFGGKGDYEDITTDDKYFYVLESSGKVFRISKTGDGSDARIFEFPRKKNTEFEAMYLDENNDKLVIICKECPGKKGSFIKYAYALDLKQESCSEEPLFTIDPSTASAGLPDLKPSAAAIHPIEKKLYVLCSVGKTLLVCDLKGKVEKLYELDPQIYEQPEGITFNKNGDMFISNEAGSRDKGNILKIAYNK